MRIYTQYIIVFINVDGYLFIYLHIFVFIYICIDI
jgi:hypothetical protein